MQNLGRGAERLQPCQSPKLAPLSFRAATYFGVFTRLHMLAGKGRARHGHILREATRLVEASWLVAEQHVRLLADSLRDRDALLLSTGHLRGKVVHRRVMHLRHREGVRRRPTRTPCRGASVRAPVVSGMAKRSYRHVSQSVCPWNVKFSRVLAEDSPFRAREFIAGKDAVALANEAER